MPLFYHVADRPIKEPAENSGECVPLGGWYSLRIGCGCFDAGTAKYVIPSRFRKQTRVPVAVPGCRSDRVPVRPKPDRVALLAPVLDVTGSCDVLPPNKLSDPSQNAQRRTLAQNCVEVVWDSTWSRRSWCQRMGKFLGQLLRAASAGAAERNP